MNTGNWSLRQEGKGDQWMEPITWGRGMSSSGVSQKDMEKSEIREKDPDELNTNTVTTNICEILNKIKPDSAVAFL